MSKLTQIEGALQAIDPATFQRLCDSYLKRRGYEMISPLGLVIGIDKVLQGTPDTLITRADGTYDFAEYSTQQEGLAGKFMEDLAKCLNEEKTGIPVGRIHEIVLCHNSRMMPKQEYELAEECRRHGTLLSIYGHGTIAHDLYQKYPGLARDFLGIEVDTGQIVTAEEFVAAYNKGSFATPLDTAFKFREDELASVLKALEDRDLVLVTGHAGVGKTRFALEVCRKYENAHPGIQARCIFNRGADLFEDLRVHFREPGHYLILVDDTNRISRFDYALQLLHDQRDDLKIKIIATVRDYALDSAQEAARPFGGAGLVELAPFKDDQVKELVREGFGITHHLYLERIAEIAQGNPRLAVMAARVAERENSLQSIADVSALYDEYFASIRRDLEELGDVSLILVAGIIAFFRVIDRSSAEQMGAITDGFKIDPDVFWRSARRLHELEMADMYEDEVVRISDQVLSTYLFYLSVFRERALDFAILLEQFFPDFRYRLVDALNPVLSAFNTDLILKTLQPPIDRAWEILQQRGDEEELLNLLDVFWFVKQTDTLIYLRDKILGLEPAPILLNEVKFVMSPALPPSPSILGILDNFRYAEDSAMVGALSLLFDYVEKRPAELPLVLRMLNERYGMTHYSHLNGFAVERRVTDALWDRTRAGNNEFFSRLFLTVAEPLLQTHFQTSEPKRKMSIAIINFDVPATPELLEFRRVLWQRIFSLYTLPALQEQVLGLLERHSGSGYLVANSKIVGEDAVQLQSFFKSAFESSVYRHCVVVQDYLDMLDRIGVEADNDLGKRFTNETYDLSELFFIDRKERRELGWEEHQRVQRERLDTYTANFDAEGFEGFFKRCAEIILASGGRHYEYQVQNGVVQALLHLAERDGTLFATVLTNYLAAGNVLNLGPWALASRLIQVCGPDRAYEILTLGDYSQRVPWLFGYFMALPADTVTEDQLQQLLALYESAKWRELLRDMDYLLKFVPLDTSVVIQVTRTLVEKSASEPGFGNALSDLFTERSEIGQRLSELFAGQLDLLKRAYFAAFEAEDYTDHEGFFFSQLLDIDPNFGQEWVNWFFNRAERPSRRDDSRDYSFIWRRDDHIVVMERIVDAVRTEGRKRLLFDSYLQNFFVLTEGTADMKTLHDRQEGFLDGMIARRNEDDDLMLTLFDIISGFGPERRRGRIAMFLSYSKDYEAFQRVPLESNSWVWTGSEVPMLQARVDFLESLLPLMNTIDLISHKQRVERLIQRRHDDIERAKRRDFVGDD